MAKTVRELEAISNSYAAIYADKTGKPVADMRALMKPETWFTAEEAVEAGFADTAGGGPAADRAEPAAFAYRAYANAPAPVLALADARGWTTQKLKAASAAPTAQTRENPMSTQPKADANSADLDKIRAEAAADAVRADRERRGAIMALPEAKGREALAEHLYMSGSTADQAKATLSVAPAAVQDKDEPKPANPQAYADARARAAAGLAGPEGTSKSAMRVDIVASMQRRFGVKA